MCGPASPGACALGRACVGSQIRRRRTGAAPGPARGAERASLAGRGLTAAVPSPLILATR